MSKCLLISICPVALKLKAIHIMLPLIIAMTFFEDFKFDVVIETPHNGLSLWQLPLKCSTVFICPVVAQICSLPVEKGRCRASMRRFFFNSTSRQCEEFRFGGCEGNANRFDTEKACNDFCGCKLHCELYSMSHLSHATFQSHLSHTTFQSRHNSITPHFSHTSVTPHINLLPMRCQSNLCA